MNSKELMKMISSQYVNTRNRIICRKLMQFLEIRRSMEKVVVLRIVPLDLMILKDYNLKFTINLNSIVIEKECQSL